MKNKNAYHTIVSLLILSSCNFWPWQKHDSIKVTRKAFSAVPHFSPISAQYNPLPSSIEITFPSEVNMASVSAADFEVLGMGSCPVTPLVSMGTNDQTTTLILNTVGCLNGNMVKVRVLMAGILNKSGHRGEGIFEHVYVFNTDNAPSPTINLVSGSFNHFSGNFKMIFNDSIDMSSVTSSMVEITGNGGCPSSPLSGFNKIGHEVTVNYSSLGCAHGDKMKFVIHNSRIKDGDGRNGMGQIDRELTMDLVGIDASQISVALASGDYNPLPTTVNISFPAEVNMDSISLADFMLTGSGSCPMPVLTSLLKTAQTVQLQLNTAGCANTDALSFTMPMSGILDNSGNGGTGSVTNTWRLVNTAPQAPTWNLPGGVVSSMPVSVALNFPSTTDMASVNSSSISVVGSGHCPAQGLSQLSKNGGTTTVVFATAGCLHGDALTVSIDMSKIKNTVGMYGVGIITQTYTLDTLGPSAPLISVDTGSFSQIPGSIVMNFGPDTNMATVNPTTLLAEGTGGCPSNALSSLSISGKTATMSISSLGCSNLDTLRIRILMPQIKDAVGNFGGAEVIKVLTLNSSVPAFPAINIPGRIFTSLPSSLSFTFDPTIDMSTVGIEDFIVQGTGHCQANPISAFSESGQQVDIVLNTSGCVHDDSFIVTLSMAGISDNSSVAGSGIFRNTYTLDIQGPALPSVNSVGGVMTAFPTTLRFDYPNDTDMSTVNLASFALTGTGSCSGASINALNIVGFAATITLDSSACSSSDQLSVRALMAGVSDNLGNAGAGEKVVSFTLDTQGPDLPVITPAGATVARIPQNITVLFSNDTLMSSVGINDFNLASSGYCSSSISNLTTTGQSAILSITSANCALNDTVTLSVAGAGITDNLGNAGSGTAQAQYILDNEGISSSSIAMSPVSALVANIPSTVSITFPADTDMNSVDLADFGAVSTGSCPASPLNSLTKSGLVASLGLNSIGCSNTNSLTLHVNMSGIKDSIGNVGTGIGIVTYTLDNVGPALATFNVASGTIRTLPGLITLTFSNDTDMNSVTSADISVSGSGACSASTLSSLSKSGQVATLVVNASSCAHGNSLNIAVNMTGVTDALGNPGVGTNGLSFVFDLLGPNAATVNLLGATRNTLPGSLTFTFSSDTSMASVDASDFNVTGDGSCPAYPMSGFTKSGQTATFNINKTSCAHNNSIIVSVNMALVTDAVGNPGTGTVVQTYILDIIGPSFPTVDQVGGSFITMPSFVIYTFPSDVDMSTVTAASFSSVSTGLCAPNAISGVTINGNTATVSIHVLNCILGSSIQLNLNMTNIKDTVGNPGVGIFSNIYSKIL